MNKVIISLAAMLCCICLEAQQKVSRFRIAETWDKQEYVLAVDGPAVCSACVDVFAQKFYGNPMLHALGASFSGEEADVDVPVAAFKADDKNGYCMIRLKSRQLAETEAKLWTLPDGKQVFVVKMVNWEEDTLPRIFFFDVDTENGRLVPGDEPDGLVYGSIENFLLPRRGNRIVVKWENRPSDLIVLQDDGSFVYLAYAANAFSCYVLDPDPSGKTNLRSSPGGKIIGQISESASDDEGGALIVSVFNPTKGWWQILEKSVGGLKISGEGWIHYSVLAMRTRNYGQETLKLHADPSAESAVTGYIYQEEATVRPMDISPDGEWTKVKGPDGTGWLESRWLCGNPYTTCP